MSEAFMVAVASAHRGDAFAACEFIMDYLKTRAPFWKKEHRPEGARWVEARTSDDAAAERWKIKPALGKKVSIPVDRIEESGGYEWPLLLQPQFRRKTNAPLIGSNSR